MSTYTDTFKTFSEFVCDYYILNIVQATGLWLTKISDFQMEKSIASLLPDFPRVQTVKFIKQVQTQTASSAQVY